MTHRFEQLYELDLPDDWIYVPDAEGGAAIPPGRDAVLHIHCEAVIDPSKLHNLSRMLAGFVTLHHKPVATDQLLEMEWPEAIGFAWQYRDEEAHRAVRLWIVGHEEAWAFLNFQCPETREPELRAQVDSIVKGFRLL